MNDQNRSSDESAWSRWAGAVICLLSVVVRALAGVGDSLRGSIGLVLALLLILVGVAWAVRGPERLRRLSELYLWLAFALSLGFLESFANRVAGWTGVDGLTVFRLVAAAHVAVVVLALWALGAWSRKAGSSAAGLLIIGAVIFWVGATTFPGMTLEEIAANRPAHMWTSGTFLPAVFITLAGLALFTVALREAGDRVLSVLGLLAFAFGSVFWTLHVAFRLTVMPWAAEEFSRTAASPAWFQPWVEFSGLLFGIYSVLANLALVAYGGAILETGLVARWAGWTCVVVGLLAAPFFGPPLFIHVPLWLVGILLVRRNEISLLHL
jgi:hypothetical protein